MLRTVSAGLPLATAFAASRDGAQIDEELEGRLARTIARARAAWPGISVQDGVFLRHLGERVPAERLERAFVEDLYLACACARGDVRAIEVFDQKYFGVLATGLAAKGIDESVADEVVQRLRTQVFVVGNGGRAKIADYAGKGPIRGWLHVAGVRLASKLRRAEANRATVARDAAAEGVPADDPEFATIRRRYGAVSSDALREAFGCLSAEERSVLRLHFVDGLNLDRIGVALGLSRATVGRRMIAARERLLGETLRLLGERLEATPTEVQSLLGFLRSQIEVSFGALIGDTTTP
jgi:RNA polymerase sigma-70 factor (ECF subfamily)